jgi:hypothetical protein
MAWQRVFSEEVQMTVNANDPYDDIDDFDPDYLPGDDDCELEPGDDTAIAGTRFQTAWQRIEHRRDMAWLRDQTADWDYWDDYLQPQ